MLPLPKNGEETFRSQAGTCLTHDGGFTLSLFIGKCQAGKLWIAVFMVLVWPDRKSNPGSCDVWLDLKPCYLQHPSSVWNLVVRICGYDQRKWEPSWYGLLQMQLKTICAGKTIRNFFCFYLNCMLLFAVFWNQFCKSCCIWFICNVVDALFFLPL